MTLKLGVGLQSRKCVCSPSEGTVFSLHQCLQCISGLVIGSRYFLKQNLILLLLCLHTFPTSTAYRITPQHGVKSIAQPYLSLSGESHLQIFQPWPYTPLMSQQEYSLLPKHGSHPLTYVPFLILLLLHILFTLCVPHEVLPSIYIHSKSALLCEFLIHRDEHLAECLKHQRCTGSASGIELR